MTWSFLKLRHLVLFRIRKSNIHHYPESRFCLPPSHNNQRSEAGTLFLYHSSGDTEITQRAIFPLHFLKTDINLHLLSIRITTARSSQR